MCCVGTQGGGVLLSKGFQGIKVTLEVGVEKVLQLRSVNYYKLLHQKTRVVLDSPQFGFIYSVLISSPQYSWFSSFFFFLPP